MRKENILFLVVVVALILAGVVSAVPDLEVEAVEKNSVIIAELERPAVYDLIINNLGEEDSFRIYTLVGVAMEPEENFELSEGETTLEVKAFLNEDIRKNERGFLSFEYQIKGRNSGIYKDKLLVKIVELSDIVEISAETLYPNETGAVVIVKNKEDVDLGEVTIAFDSVFFRTIEEVSLGPKREVHIPVGLNKEGLEKILAGHYIISASVGLEDVKADVEGIIDYLEKEGISVEKQSEGFIIRKKTVKKTNKGNTQTTAHIEFKKDILSRLFTTNSIEPTLVDRGGLVVTYSWDKNLAPGEFLVVETTTNYTFPFILLLVIIFIGVGVRIYTHKAIALNKQVSFVRTKGGEFALKVRVYVKARKHVDKVQLVDSLPRMTKLYHGFGKKPDKIDKHTRRLFWDIGNLRKGEKRVYSYVIYSKLSVVGRFELPSASAIFEKEGKVQEVWSNRAFFAAEKD
ncbi:MAG: hypothetical protein ABIH92_00060 [Nanoarchaeota archaeon]